MKNLVLGLGFILVSLFVVSCSQQDELLSELTEQELVTLKTEVQNSEQFKIYQESFTAFSEQVTSEKIALEDILSEIKNEQVTMDCDFVTNFESRKDGYKEFQNFVCEISQNQIELHENFKILDELSKDEIEYIFSLGTLSRNDINCADVFFISLEFYGLYDAMWAYYHCVNP